MTARIKIKRAPEELVKKAKLALSDQAIAKIAESALTNKDGTINLSNVYDRVFEHVFGATKDLKKAKEFAVSARWLAMLKRDFPMEYKIQMIEAEKVWTKEKRERAAAAEPLAGTKAEFTPTDAEIALMGDIVFPDPSRFSDNRVLRIHGFALPYSGLKMAADLLRAITGIEPSQDKRNAYASLSVGFGANFRSDSSGDPECLPEKRLAHLRDYLIQILEEKFGLKIRTCVTCKHYHYRPSFGSGGACKLAQPEGKINNFCWHADQWCTTGGWTPKEAAKEETRKICGTCGHYSSGFASRSRGICGAADRKESIKFSDCCCFITSRWKPREASEEKK